MRERGLRRLALRLAAALEAHRVAVAVVVPGLVALGVGAYQLSLPGVLSGVHGYFNGVGYDDGVYMGAALRLVHGAMPYKDFVLLHPPGVPLLMAPVAALGDLIGTHDAFGMARVVTVIVAALNASLAAVAVRYRGVGAMLIAGTALACFPLAVAADHSVFLEPFLVFFCLLGVVAIFQEGRLADPSRLLLAGLAFGFAASVKVWAIIPIAVAVAACIPIWKKGVRPLLLGVVVGVAVPCLPFFVAAPHAFLHDIVADQLSRVAPSAASLPIGGRLLMLTGLSGLTLFHAQIWLAWVTAIALVVFVGIVYATSVRSSKRADWFLLGAATTSTAAMCITQAFSDHYAYFPAAFIAMVVGICMARVVSTLAGSKVAVLGRSSDFVIPVVLSLAAVLFLVPQQVSYAKSYLAGAEDPSLVLQSVIPQGACVLADEVSYSIAADRFNPGVHGCPSVIDALGVWFATLPKHLPPFSGPYPPPFVATWGQWFSEADYVVLVVPAANDDFFPWTAQLTSWFDTDFQLIVSQPGMYVYQHVTHTSPPQVTPVDTADQLVSAGLAAQRAGNASQAFADYQAAVAKSPNNVYANYDLGYIYQQRGDAANAASYYRKALLINPKFGDALYNLGVLQASTNPTSAISYYEQDLQVDPNNASANFNLGVLLIKQGQTSQGDTYLETGLRLNPALSAYIPPGVTLPQSVSR